MEEGRWESKEDGEWEMEERERKGVMMAVIALIKLSGLCPVCGYTDLSSCTGIPSARGSTGCLKG